MTWRDYAKLWSGDAADSEVTKALGLANSTVGRWGKSEPSPTAVRSFAEHYGRAVARIHRRWIPERIPGE